MRPGWGERLPEVADLLRRSTPVATEETAWADGTLPLRISAYTNRARLPDEIVRSVRCLVRVDDLVVVCTNAHGISHPWPGGRREAGETHAETACREVLEETGWIVQPTSLCELGWLHMEHLTPQDDDWPHPHPDFLQVVLVGTAVERSGGKDAAWTDTEGYELESVLMTLDDAYLAAARESLSLPFLDLLR